MSSGTARPDPRRPAPNGPIGRCIEKAWEQGYQAAKVQSRRRQLVGTAASLVAVVAFDLGRRRNWW